MYKYKYKYLKIVEINLFYVKIHMDPYKNPVAIHTQEKENYTG